MVNFCNKNFLYCNININQRSRPKTQSSIGGEIKMKMQVINKPQNHILPYNIQKRITTQYKNQNDNQISQIYQKQMEHSNSRQNEHPSLKIQSQQQQYSMQNQYSNQVVNSNSNVFAIQRQRDYKNRLLPKSQSKQIFSSKSNQRLMRKNIDKLPTIPNLYLQPRDRSRRAKSTYQHINSQITISYTKDISLNAKKFKEKQQQKSKFRESIRKALSSKISFIHLATSHGRFLSEELLKKLKQPIKAIPYTTQKYQFLFNNVKQIFGDDFQITNKDVIAAYGTVTQSYYIFFTSLYYQPVSLCCNDVIYLRVETQDIYPGRKYAKKDANLSLNNQHISFQRKVVDGSIVSKFVCSKCTKPAIIVRFNSPSYVEQSKVIGKQALQFQAERQRISMSIIVASGRFKRMRIDEASQKGTTINLDNSKINVANSRYNPEINSIKHKSRTLGLKNIDSLQII